MKIKRFGAFFWPKYYAIFSRYAWTRAQYCSRCELQTAPEGRVVAEVEDALLAVDHDLGQAPLVAVVVTEPRKLGSDLLKLQKT